MTNSKNRGLLIVMSGPSGVGKGTVRELLMKDNTLNLFFSVSMTTRAIRPGEINGVDYYFVTREEFMKNVNEGNLLEWNEYVGNCYGTPKDKVEEMRNKGENVLLEIDINGASQVFKRVDDVLSIFIAPPSFEALEARLKGRGTEPEEVIKNRVERAKKELKHESSYKYVVINDDLEKAVEKIKEIILSEMRGR